MSSIFKTWLIPTALAVSLSGCIFVEDDADDEGSIALEWSLFGDIDPRDCRDTGSDRLELSIYDVFGDLVTTRYPYCEDFGASLSLEEGTYSVYATLVDGFNESVTLTRIVDDIDVIDDFEVEVLVDFPLDAFL